jgi:hypothetical protein
MLGGKLHRRLPVAALFILFAVLAPASTRAGHEAGPCEPPGIKWAELVREDDNKIEKGVSANIEVILAEADDPEHGGAIIRSIYAWKNDDNSAEIGWAWEDDGEHVRPTLFWELEDDGLNKYNHFEGPAGFDGFKDYKLLIDPPPAHHWKFRVDGELKWEEDFENMAFVNPVGSSEIHEECNSAKAHHKDLKDIENVGDPWGDWSAIERWAPTGGTFVENPCFHTEIISDTAFRVEHGAGGGEICP